VGGPPAAIDPDGWLDTGDLGHLDADGYLFLAGRSDDVINRGGEKIYPREIEEFLLAQPGVRGAAVVAARDEVLGQRPVAYVVASRPGIEEALRAACEAALPRAKRPDAFHVVAELPTGPTGKVARTRLRELAAAVHREGVSSGTLSPSAPLVNRAGRVPTNGWAPLPNRCGSKGQPLV
jgi:oxalate---CoA ligase